MMIRENKTKQQCIHALLPRPFSAQRILSLFQQVIDYTGWSKNWHILFCTP